VPSKRRACRRSALHALQDEFRKLPKRIARAPIRPNFTPATCAKPAFCMLVQKKIWLVFLCSVAVKKIVTCDLAAQKIITREKVFC
jgi:hypothetical protein